MLATADAKSASGAVSIEQVEGDCRADSASGDIELGTIGGAVGLQERLGRPPGRPGRRALHGAIGVGRRRRRLGRRPGERGVSVSGDVTVRDAARGEVICKSTSGNIAVGVRKGTLVWLDLTTVSGPHHLRASSPTTRRRRPRRRSSP